MSESLRTSRSLLEEAAKVLKSELTAGQKKLPPALQKAIKDKEDKKEDSHTPADKMKKKEELSDKQKKMDMNKNGKIDGEDLAKLRTKKEELEILIAELETKLEE